MKVEVQLWREMKALSQPTAIILPDKDGGMQFYTLPAGWGAEHQLRVGIDLYRVGYTYTDWLALSVGFGIDGITMGIVRPGILFCQPTDIPSGIIHYPPVTHPENPNLGGWHTLTLRTVEADVPALSGDENDAISGRSDLPATHIAA